MKGASSYVYICKRSGLLRDGASIIIYYYYSVPQIKQRKITAATKPVDLGVKAACATVSPRLYTLTYIHTYQCSDARHAGGCAPTSGIAIMEFVMSWRLLQLKVRTVIIVLYTVLFSLSYRLTSFMSHVILVNCFKYPPKWCTYGCYMAGATWNCCRLGARSLYTIQPCTSLQCHFIRSHIRKVCMCVQL